jgi:hypothetical protein
MNHLMAQNAGISYPNMINYPMNMQVARPIDLSNPIQYSFQQSQAQRFIYPYILNQGIQNPNPINLPLQNMQNIQNIQINNVVLDNSTTKADTNNSNATQNNSSNSTLPPLKLLTKYKDIYVPSIYLLDYSDISKAPFNILANQSQNQAQSYNQMTGQVMNNNQSNNILSKYFNYGYNFEQWKLYVNEIKNKFDELNELVKNGNIRLPDPENELEYLMSFPSDYGGLGNVQNDQNYENVKFYDPKDTTKNLGNKNFMSLIRFDNDQTWFPMKPNPSPLNKQFNDINKNINSSVNPYMKFIYPQNFLIRNPNTIPNAIASNNSEQKGTNGNNSNKDDKNKKER